jgi:hypothetical protein
MAKMKARATTDFWPPDSDFMSVHSALLKLTWSSIS